MSRSRILSYDNVLGKYDLLDKYNLSFKVRLSPKTYCVLQSPSNLNLNQILLNEFLSQRKIHSRKPNNKITALSYFNTSLRKDKLYTYFETLLNSTFITYSTLNVSKHLPLSFTFKFMYNNILFKHFNTDLIQKSSTLTINSNFFFHFNQYNNLNLKNYYFLPLRQLGE